MRRVEFAEVTTLNLEIRQSKSLNLCEKSGQYKLLISAV